MIRKSITLYRIVSRDCKSNLTRYPGIGILFFHKSIKEKEREGEGKQLYSSVLVLRWESSWIESGRLNRTLPRKRLDFPFGEWGASRFGITRVAEIQKPITVKPRQAVDTVTCVTDAKSSANLDRKRFWCSNPAKVLFMIRPNGQSHNTMIWAVRTHSLLPIQYYYLQWNDTMTLFAKKRSSLTTLDDVTLYY